MRVLLRAMCVNGPIGSTVVTPYADLMPIELGASVFVKANKNLWRATDEFGLERTDFEDEKSFLGIWDGEEVVLSVCLMLLFRVPT